MEFSEISVRGALIRVPSLQVEDRTITVTGGWLKLAAVKDEDFQEGEITSDLTKVAGVLRKGGLGVDILTFSQKLTNPQPRLPFFYEQDSIAVIPVVSFSDWWNNRVSSDLRKDVRRAAKRGVMVRAVDFTDEFVRGIVGVYDETPIRHGRPFWHYKKGFDVVKRENSTYLERSEFLGAFLGDELIGFLKIVRVDRLARLMQIIAKDAHRDKRPMNALIAKAVEICDTKRYSHLTYGKFRYSHGSDSLTAFKYRNGFEEITVPKYYIPLSAKGRIALRLHLHHGAKGLMPESTLKVLRRLRAAAYRQ